MLNEIKPHVKIIAHNDELVEILGTEIIKKLQEGLSKNGKASLVVSGGSTPKSLFSFLSQQNIDWENITITLADERCVNQSETNSNAHLVKNNLLVNYSETATFIPLYQDNESPSEAAL